MTNLLNYRLIGDNDYIFDPQGTVLNNRGIIDIDTFINPTEQVVHNPFLLKNLNKAIDCLLKHIENKSVITIVVDPDADGYTSAALLYQYLMKIDDGITLKWVLHDDKVHGLDNIEIPYDTNLIIVPDAGSNDFEKHKEYKEKGMDIIILDHHELEEESKDVIVVNSRLGNYPNLNLSGVGITYKFCKALDHELWVDHADYFLDLVAVGNIADSMSMKELETRYYVNKGLSQINNGFLKALIKKQEFSMKGKVNITTVSFYINPLINSVIRVGTLNEKNNMFKAFIGVNELIKYKPRGSDEEILMPLLEDMARQCVNIKARQNRIKNKIVPIIEETIFKNELINNKVIFINGIQELEPGLTGLISNDIAGKYKKPVIILNPVESNGILKGSARGYDKSELKDFKDIALSTGLFEYAKGHLNAYGVGIHKDNIDKLNDVFNDLLSQYDFEDVYDIDFSIPFKSMNGDLIYCICELEDVWGKDVEEPYLLITDIPLQQLNISLIGKKEDTICIDGNGIKYMFFKRSKDHYKELKNGNRLHLIGRASINIYKNEKQPQIIVDDFEIS